MLESLPEELLDPELELEFEPEFEFVTEPEDEPDSLPEFEFELLLEPLLDSELLWELDPVRLLELLRLEFSHAPSAVAA